MIVVTVHNSKGGCGKTTTACNVAVNLANAGARVLLIDGDPQASATLGLGSTYRRAVFDWLVGNTFRPDGVRTRLDLLPGQPTPDWRDEVTVDILVQRTNGLQYDWMIVDTHPEYDRAVASFIEISDIILIPVDLGYYSVARLANFMPEMPKDRILGLVPVRYDLRMNSSIELLDMLKKAGGGAVAPPIRQSAALENAARKGLAACEYDPRSRGAEDYQILTEWMVKRFAEAQESTR